ncbi:hypothetical protein E3J59_04625 [Candidatus Aerophobetes bacterium]|uniref:C-type cytochrome biogenesis protein CcmI n=1 Tax=Aerophobetes bacterium TaxID=2030807 RepID=A0A523UQK7_UNCAE|nr:MAG: hypothetical protein E3J59_04625 [Candidatus Aerophobetes bacterium]
MLIVFLIVISVLVFTVIVYPLAKGVEDTEKKSSVKDQLAQLLLQKESSYLDLKELELDYRMGKLSQQDYERLRSKLERASVALLKETEQLELGKPREKENKEEIDQEIEQEILRMRRIKKRDKGEKE